MQRRIIPKFSWSIAVMLIACLLFVFGFNSFPKNAEAAMHYETGTFTKSTTTGTQSITGLGFEPKVVIFYWTRQTATGFSVEQSYGMGFASGPDDERVVAFAEDDAAATSNAGRRRSEDSSILILSDGTPTVGAEAELTSFDADGFTLNWLSNEANAGIIHYIALGGTDVENIDIGTFSVNTAIGAQSVTGVGFAPEALITLHAGTGAVDTNLSDAAFSMGMASGATEEGGLYIGSVDAEASNATKISTQSTTSFLLNEGPSSVDAVANLTSFDADGFTIDITDAPALSFDVFYLALSGGNFNVGSFNQPTTTGFQTVTGNGFMPSGVLFASVNELAGASRSNPSTLSLGSAQFPTEQGSVWAEANNVDPSDTNSYTSTTDVVTLATSTSTTNAQADYVTPVDDGFSLDWTAVDGTAREILYFTVGTADVAIDTSADTAANAFLNSSPSLVFTDRDTGYAFYRDISNRCEYSKTTDGGETWSAPLPVDLQTDCVRVAVWYDQWTPGDTGDLIHILTMDTGSDDLWYTELDTTSDTLTTTVNASGAGQAGTFAAGANIPSITKGTDGDLYMGIQDGGDSFVIKCTTTCETGTNWVEAGAATQPFDNSNDSLILMPLSGGDIMAIRWDISENDIDSNIYTDGTDSWAGAGSWVDIDTNAVDNTTFDGGYGATLDPSTGDIYLAYLGDVGTLGTDDDIRTAIYDESAGTWSAGTDILTNDVKGLTGVKTAFDSLNGDVYVIYTARTSAASALTANVYWNRSTDDMSSWGGEQGPINNGNEDIRGPMVNLISDARIQGMWWEAAPDDMMTTTVALLDDPALLEQEAYRFFNNDDSTDVGTPLASQDAPAELASSGDAFRLRALLEVSYKDLATGAQDFKLQFAEQSGTCDTGFVGETYADVTASSTIAFNNNATPADGAAVTTNANDPTGPGTVVAQTYEELNNFTSTSSVSVGDSGLWDFALIDNGAPANTTYCFRIVESDGSTLETYTSIPELSTYAATFRITEYFLDDDGSADFTGTTYTLTLDQDLEDDYFVFIQGSDGSGTLSTGPDENYMALTSDPSGTGDLSVSGAANQLGFTRGNSVAEWYGVVTVVECLMDCDGSGFNLLDVQRTAHGTSASGTDTSGTAWTDINQVALFGSYNGAGCDTAATGATDHNSCWARLFPSGSDTINWERDGTGQALEAATTTTMVVEWGSEWTVQRVNVTGTNGGNGVDATGEYNTGALGSTITRDQTWVWGTGTSNDNGIGDGSEAALITLGDGVNQNATESTVAVGIEYSQSLDFTVYAFTHPDLVTDYVFKVDGNSADLVYDATVTSADASARMAFIQNGSNGTGTAFPRPIWSARYTSDTNIRAERRRSGQNWPAWIQGIDFSDIREQPGALTVDIVDAGGVSVVSPSVDFGDLSFSFDFQTTTATLGVSSERVRVTNTTGNAAWSASIGATSGSTAVWTNGSNSFDFNDPTASAVDGADTDAFGGQLSIDPSVGTISPQGGCSTTGITLGSSSAFSEGVTDSINLLSASASADTNCYWDLTDVDLSQTIPAEQSVGTGYAIDMTVTVVAM